MRLPRMPRADHSPHDCLAIDFLRAGTSPPLNPIFPYTVRIPSMHRPPRVRAWRRVVILQQVSVSVFVAIVGLPRVIACAPAVTTHCRECRRVVRPWSTVKSVAKTRLYYWMPSRKREEIRQGRPGRAESTARPQGALRLELPASWSLGIRRYSRPAAQPACDRPRRADGWSAHWSARSGPEPPGGLMQLARQG